MSVSTEKLQCETAQLVTEQLTGEPPGWQKHCCTLCSRETVGVGRGMHNNNNNQTKHVTNQLVNLNLKHLPKTQANLRLFCLSSNAPRALLLKVASKDNKYKETIHRIVLDELTFDEMLSAEKI